MAPPGLVAYAFEPRRRAALMRALGSLAAVAPWPAGSTLALVRLAGQPPLGGQPALQGLRVLELEDDGRRWEFGAWQRGIERIASEFTPSAWLLLNDTAGVNDPWLRAERVRLRQLADRWAGGSAPPLALGGSWRAAPAGAALAGQALQGWIQTHAFVLSAPALRALGGRLFDAELFAAPRVSGGQIALPPSVSPALAGHITTWLTRSDRHGWRYHSGRASVSDTLLRDKAGSVLLEKHLAAEVLAAGGSLHDCRLPALGPLEQLGRRFFYLQRRATLALASRRVA
jgi:hypothetical protein